jgi:uncharacterized delta-60 repeat protein
MGLQPQSTAVVAEANLRGDTQMRAIRSLRALALPVLILGATSLARAGGAGTLDPTYGDLGIAVTAVNDGTDFMSVTAHGVEAGTDSVVVVGNHGGSVGTYTLNGQTYLIRPAIVRRFTSEGDRDSGFGSGGEVLLFQDHGGHALAVALDGDGRSFVGGDATYLVTSGSGRKATTTAVTRAVIACLRPDGRLDSSFGAGGVLVLGVPGAISATVKELVVVADGGLAVGGTAVLPAKGKPSTRTWPFVSRFSSSGSPLAFGSGGIVVDTRVESYVGGSDNVHGIGVQPGGHVVLGFEGSSGWTITRYAPSGAPDSGFGVLVRTGAQLAGLTVLGDGRLLACGQETGSASILVARYAADGTQDDFGVAGEVLLAPRATQGAYGVPVVTEGGAILVATTLRDEEDAAAAVAPLRLAADGTPDEDFGPGGFGELLLPSLSGGTPLVPGTVAWGVSVLASGAVLLRGEAWQTDAVYRFLARYLP